MSEVSAPVETGFDPAKAALTALSRAGLPAAEDARSANICMVVAEDGQVLHESTKDLRKRGEPITQSSAIPTPDRKTSMHPAISRHRPGIATICQRYGIQRLEVFGSAARASDFDPAHSDADFLVEFAPGVEPDLQSIFGAKADLEALLGRGVDLVEPGAVRNPYVLASVNRQRAIIFSAED